MREHIPAGVACSSWLMLPSALPPQAMRLRDEGIMIKALDSHWMPNDRSHRWLKCVAPIAARPRAWHDGPPKQLAARPLPAAPGSPLRESTHSNLALQVQARLPRGHGDGCRRDWRLVRSLSLQELPLSCGSCSRGYFCAGYFCAGRWRQVQPSHWRLVDASAWNFACSLALPRGGKGGRGDLYTQYLVALAEPPEGDAPVRKWVSFCRVSQTAGRAGCLGGCCGPWDSACWQRRRPAPAVHTIAACGAQVGKRQAAFGAVHRSTVAPASSPCPTLLPAVAQVGSGLDNDERKTVHDILEPLCQENPPPGLYMQVCGRTDPCRRRLLLCTCRELAQARLHCIRLEAPSAAAPQRCSHL